MKMFWDLTNEQLSEIFDAALEDWKKQKAELAIFFKSEEFYNLIAKIKEELKTSESLFDNPYKKPLFADVSNEQFCKVFSCLFEEEASNLKPIADRSGFFESEYVVFEGLRFGQTHGQGTSCGVRKEEETVSLPSGSHWSELGPVARS